MKDTTMEIETFFEEVIFHPLLIKRFPQIVALMINFKISHDMKRLRKTYELTTGPMESLIILELMIMSLSNEEENNRKPTKGSEKKEVRISPEDLKNYCIIFKPEFYEKWWKAKEKVFIRQLKREEASPFENPVLFLNWVGDYVEHLTNKKVFAQDGGVNMAFYLLETLFRTDHPGIFLKILHEKRKDIQNTISPGDIESLHDLVLDLANEYHLKLINPNNSRILLFAEAFLDSSNQHVPVHQYETLLARLNLLSQYPILRVTIRGFNESSTLYALETLEMYGAEPYLPPLINNPKCDALNEFVGRSEKVVDIINPDNNVPSKRDSARRKLKETEFLIKTSQIIIDYYSNMSHGCCESHSKAMETMPILKNKLQNSNYVKSLTKRTERSITSLLHEV